MRHNITKQNAAITRWIAVALCVTLLLGTILVLASCTSKVVDFAVGEIRTVYSVDEAFDPAGAKLKVRYANNTEAYINIKADMAVEFDTSTSGEKTCNIQYQGILRPIKYIVLGNINTKTRITLNTGTGAECIIGVANVSFPIYALTFVLKGDISDIIGELVPLSENWKIQTNKQQSQILVLIYTDNGNPITQDSTIFNFLCYATSAFSVTDIQVTAKEVQYQLPDVFSKIVE